MLVRNLELIIFIFFIPHFLLTYCFLLFVAGKSRTIFRLNEISLSDENVIMNTIISGSENQKDLSQRLVVRKYKFVISIDIKFIVLGMLLDCTSQR